MPHAGGLRHFRRTSPERHPIPRSQGTGKGLLLWSATHPPIYTDSRISTLFRESIAPKTDGEDAEAQAAALAVMLGVIGDQKFASHLSRESSAVQKATLVSVKPLWTLHRLNYPETQKLAASMKVR